ncbi:MAG: DUF3794 domain-containing protein [Defluviitaleaceae bacterium]|nr:DUF3794 domain-containing protein [Defluviitaleaceae bacterium]
MHNVIRKNISLDRALEKEQTQILIEGEVLAPDNKPDIGQILGAEAEVFIERFEIGAERINYKAKLELKILYLSNGVLQSLVVSKPAEDFINVLGLTKEANVKLNAQFLNIEYVLINDRKVSYKSIVNVTAQAVIKETHELVTEIVTEEGEIFSKRSEFSVHEFLKTSTDRITIKEEIELTAEKGQIDEILTTNARVHTTETRVTPAGASVSGILNLSFLYRSGEVVDFIEKDVPFSSTLPLESEDAFVDVTLVVIDRHTRLAQNDDGEERIIDAEITILANVSASEKRNIELLTDIYGTKENIETQNVNLNYPRFILQGKSQANVKEIVNIEGPEILQVFRVSGNVVLDEVTIYEDRIVAEGVIDADILYIAKSDSTPMYSFKQMIPFSHTVEAMGARSGMSANVFVALDSIHFNMLTEKEVELRTTISFNNSLTENLTTEAITDVSFSELGTDDSASMTVYIVQRGDTLWKIAKRYKTSPDELASVNEIEDPNLVFPGQKLIIIKNA